MDTKVKGVWEQIQDKYIHVYIPPNWSMLHRSQKLQNLNPNLKELIQWVERHPNRNDLNNHLFGPHLWYDTIRIWEYVHNNNSDYSPFGRIIVDL